MIYPVEGVEAARAATVQGYVSFQLNGQWLGIAVECVQEVLVAQRISPVPLAPDEVAGFLNLRGQIVTAIDLRTRLGLPRRADDQSCMNIVVRDGEELFSLVADAVGDVVEAPGDALEPTPRTLEPLWRSVCEGVIRLPIGLLLVVNVDELLHGTADKG